MACRKIQKARQINRLRTNACPQCGDRMGTGACPQNMFPPVPTVGTKRVVKEVCKEREENRAPSSSNPPTAMPKAKIQNQNLADLVVATAVETNRTASVSGKSKAEIVRVIGETNATEDEVVPIVRQIVECMDDF